MVLNYPIVVAKIKVTGSTAEVLWSQDIPKGLVGGRVLIEYVDECWNSLNKTVVFRGVVTRDVLENGSEVVIPSEVLARSGVNLYVGVYGTDAENELGIPTFWAKLGVIRDAADPDGDPAADSSLPVWARLLERTPDWQAEPSSDNHILNRTHWIDGEGTTPTFDGDLNGRKYVQLDEGFYFVKVTDQILPMDSFKDAVCSLHINGNPAYDEEIVITEDMISDGSSYDFPAFTIDELILVAQQNFAIEGISFAKGIYFLCVQNENGSGGYVKSCSALEGMGENVHKLDNKFIDAEWMANRVSGSEVILEEATQSFSGSTRRTARQFFQFVLEAGERYEVTWDDENYLCTAGEIREGQIAASYLGNLYLLDSDYPDTGEPFAVACLTVLGAVLFTQIATMEEADTHVVGIRQVGQIRNRIPFQFMPKRYIFPSDFSYTGVVEEELEKAFTHLNKGGEVYANYANTLYKVLMIDYDLWDGQYHYLVMTDGRTIMMWNAQNGWSRYGGDSFTIGNSDGNKYRFYVNSEGSLVSNKTTL